jgi:hypothetical protein
MRLLLRISARYPTIATVRYWSAMDAGVPMPPPFIAACLPGLPVSQLSKDEWH